ncbi:hypothetical protein NC652_019064 [Populus alba x Populus x berolinensis]|nr:hypothetical protein NC652_019064 [Populus alba x Populus x berolinensis]
MEVLRKDSAHGTTILSATFIRCYYVPLVWHMEQEFLQDCQTPTLIMSPSRTLDLRCSSSGGIFPNMASSSHIPLGADLKGLGPSSDHLLVESCSKDHVPKPSDHHNSKHYSVVAQPPLTP